MRKLTALLLSLLMLSSMSFSVFADDATITTTVPDSHTIAVTADGADVFCNGQSGSRFRADRLSEPTLLIRAVSGKEITKISLNDEDITDQVKGGYYTLEPIYEDKTLTVVTKDEPEAQGRTYFVQGTVMRNGQPVEGVTVELRSTLKTSVTDRNGKFSFRNVECGKHSMTAIENGRIIGYTEFVLTEGYAAALSLSEGIYTVTTNQNEIGINLTMNMTENAIAVIEAVSAVSAASTPGGPNSPQTGDNSNVWLWGVLMLISFTGFFAALGYRRK